MKNRSIDPFPPPAETLAKEGQGDRDDTNGQRLCEEILGSNSNVSQKLKYLRAGNKKKKKGAK
jgi:hypothetical protein